MPASLRGPGLLFRFLVAGMTAVMMVSVLSLASAIATGQAVAGDATGRFLQDATSAQGLLTIAQIAVGIITFIGSFFVLSRK